MYKPTILLADDEETLRKNVALVLEEEGFQVLSCPDGAKALEVLQTTPVDAIITDLRMPGLSGMELIDEAQKLTPSTGIIVITAFGEVETAVEAMRKGATDYLGKPLIFDELLFKLKRLLAQSELTRQNTILKEQIKKVQMPTGLIAESDAMKQIAETIQKVAHTMSKVLICGESGTGKEVLARALHYGGVTADKPFVAVNCGGLVDTLVESELFGYRRGAFTGATSDRMGYFEAADGGTLFLDEIGNLPLVSQAVLLRAIEERAITRVGDNKSRPVNIRLIAATNRDLESAIEAGEFREDLYYRLNVIRITVPPLRERPRDVAALIDHFVAKYNGELNCECPGFTSGAIAAMCNHRWRGNVRELENVIERALIFAGDRFVCLEDLPFVETEAGDSPMMNLRAAMRQFEKRHVLQALSSMDNNKATVAEALGIGLSSLYRKLEEFGVSKPTSKV